jgi:hypothetical protein
MSGGKHFKDPRFPAIVRDWLVEGELMIVAEMVEVLG